MLKLTQAELANLSQVAQRTIAMFEIGGANPQRSTTAAIRRALEDAGIQFIDADEHGGPGVRLRESLRQNQAQSQ